LKLSPSPYYGKKMSLLPQIILSIIGALLVVLGSVSLYRKQRGGIGFLLAGVFLILLAGCIILPN
jgi:uncharacterized membrane protein